MKITKGLVYVILIFSTLSCFGSEPDKKDTLYYFVNIEKAPAKDRMLFKDTEGRFNLYVFDVACLNYGKKPTFYYDRIKESGEVIAELNSIHFISLAQLIVLAQEGGGDLFNKKHVAFFIEPEKYHFLKYKVQLFKPVKPQIAY